MSQESTIKRYPATTGEVARMLGIHPAQNLPLSTISSASGGHSAMDLPVENVEQPHLEEPNETKAVTPAALRVLKVAAPYTALFLVGIFLYFFFLGGSTFTSVLNSVPKVEISKQTTLQELQKQEEAAYQAWMRSFYYDISDSRIFFIMEFCCF